MNRPPTTGCTESPKARSARPPAWVTVACTLVLAGLLGATVPPLPGQPIGAGLQRSGEPSVATIAMAIGSSRRPSSVAAVYKNRLLIGSVFEGFLVCELVR